MGWFSVHPQTSSVTWAKSHQAYPTPVDFSRHWIGGSLPSLCSTSFLLLFVLFILLSLQGRSCLLLCVCGSAASNIGPQFHLGTVAITIVQVMHNNGHENPVPAK